jgi:hypothetical protein
VIDTLFIGHPEVEYWKFEVAYLFLSGRSLSAAKFTVNRPAMGGTCSIAPTNGTILTLFTISCQDWFDPHQIKGYSIYGKCDQRF